MTILSDVAACSLLAFAALHDMAVVENVTDRLAVMSPGQIVEMARAPRSSAIRATPLRSG